MSHYENNWLYNQKDKPKKHRTKKSEQCNNLVSKHSKNTKNGKHQKHRKHTKIGCMNTVSDFVGPERLTKHVGFFTKGKISNSIRRIEKNRPKEVQARVKQDLKEVLKLTCSGKNKRKIFNTIHENISSKEQSFQISLNSPQYLYNKTGFASSSWKDKLQKSVGLNSVSSILDSVHEPLHKGSPIEEPQLIVRNLLLDRIHPFIKMNNNFLFPEISNKDKLKRRLQHVKDHFFRTNALSDNTCCTSDIQESSHVSQTAETINSQTAETNNSQTAGTNNSQNSVNEDFYLNPIFMGETINECDVTKIFPSVKEIKRSNLNRHLDFTDLPNDSCDSQKGSVQASSSVGKSSSMTLVHTSPTSSDNSPAWKLQTSPFKFIPELGSTPTLYFRHKMF